MSIVNGDVQIRAGSEDYIDLTLLKDDGVTPVDLSGATSIEMALKNVQDAQDTKSFKTTDNPQKLSISDATAGKIQLQQKAADFPASAKYHYYVIITDATGAHPIPDGKTPDGRNFYEFLVIEKI